MNVLELRFYPIQGKQDGFKVIVEGSSGEVDHEPILPFLDPETPDNQDRRFTVVKVLESIQFEDKNFSEDEQEWMVREQFLLADRSNFHQQYLTRIGRKLYHILGQRIQQVMATAITEAKKGGTFLHIRLQFPANEPKYVRLTDYPWELLHDEYDFLRRQGVIFSRYIAYRSPPPSLPSVERLQVLLMSSRVADPRMKLHALPAVEPDAIARGLEQAENQGIIQLETLDHCTLKSLRRRLLQRQTTIPHILHFDGHGFFGKRCNQIGCRKAYKQRATHCECGAPLGEPQGYLVFEQSDGQADYVSAKELGELLANVQRREQPNSPSGIVLVVLSACRSGMSRRSEFVFNGVAQNLIFAGVPAVVAMTYSIRVDAACELAEEFYYMLGQKEPLVSALHLAQSAMEVESNQWYRPLLYLRWQDNQGGQLFKDDPILPDTANSNHPILLFSALMLDNQQKKQLREALISAFPSESDLEMMLDDELEIQLNTIPNANSYTQVIRNVVKWFERYGQLINLVQAAYRANPGNPKLKQFMIEMDLEHQSGHDS